MNRFLLPFLLALTCLPALSACSQPESGDTDSGLLAQIGTELSEGMQQAAEQARQELATENIDISDETDPHSASITPKGDLLIDGQPVEITADQRQLLLEYRGHIVAIAQAGIAIGMRGASLGADALSRALASAFTGQTEKLEAKMEAKGEALARQAQTLVCGRLPAMLATQQALAAALPEFAPYADMTQQDVDDCEVDLGDGHVDVNVDADNAATDAQPATDGATP